MHKPASAFGAVFIDMFQRVSRFGAKPKPTVIVRTIENGKVLLLPGLVPVGDAFPSP
jgi:hypothetical protein